MATSSVLIRDVMGARWGFSTRATQLKVRFCTLSRLLRYAAISACIVKAAQALIALCRRS